MADKHTQELVRESMDGFMRRLQGNTPVKINTETGEITFSSLGYDPYKYSLLLEDIASPMGLIRWFVHLSEKVWFDQEHQQDFIRAVCASKGWEYRGNLCGE